MSGDRYQMAGNPNYLTDCQAASATPDGINVPISPFRVGGQYRTRDGTEARVYAVGCAYGQIHGATREFQGWRLREWQHTGRYEVFDVDHPSDLMPPTRKVTHYLTVWRSGPNIRCQLSTTETQARSTASVDALIVAMPIEWTEPEP